MTLWSRVLNGRQDEEKEFGVLCTLSHWEHSQPVRPEVTGSFEMVEAGTDRVLDGTLPLECFLPAPSLGSVRVRRKLLAAGCLDGFNFGFCAL